MEYLNSNHDFTETWVLSTRRAHIALRAVLPYCVVGAAQTPGSGSELL